MAVRGSKKPCPGCNCVKDSRRPDEVCYDCANAIDEHHQMRKAFNERIAVTAGVCCLENQHEKLGASILGVIKKSVGNMPSSSEAKIIGGSHRVTFSSDCDVTTDIRDMFSAITAALGQARIDGFNRGKSLLQGLNDGSLSTTDFERTISDEERRHREARERLAGY